MFLWRISNYATLDGIGGMLAAGRWHSKGQPIVYCAPNPATALLEVLVHSGEFELPDMPASYQFLKIDAPDTIDSKTVLPQDLLAGWQSTIKMTRQIGDRWLAANNSALLHVPSVIVPVTLNCLINPRHPESVSLHVLDILDYPLDERLK